MNPFSLVEGRAISTCVMEMKLIQITDCPDLLDEPMLAYQRLIDRMILVLSRKSRFNTEQVWVGQPLWELSVLDQPNDFGNKSWE